MNEKLLDEAINYFEMAVKLNEDIAKTHPYYIALKAMLYVKSFKHLKDWEEM